MNVAWMRCGVPTVGMVAMSIWTTPTAAQRSGEMGVTVLAGPSTYDLSGTGTAAVFGLATPFTVNRWMTVEPGVQYLRYRTQFSDHTVYLLPELSVQDGPRLGRFTPYLGTGVGGAVVVSGPGSSDPTLHAALGIRTAVAPAWAVRGEARVRGIDPWVGSTADLTLGITRRL